MVSLFDALVHSRIQNLITANKADLKIKKIFPSTCQRDVRFLTSLMEFMGASMINILMIQAGREPPGFTYPSSVTCVRFELTGFTVQV